MIRGVLDEVKATDWLIAVIWIAVTIWLGYGVTRAEFSSLSLGLGILFVAYLGIMLFRPDRWRFYVWLGVIARITLLFCVPALSDDVYRFIWDGRLWVAGENPFSFLPIDYVSRGYDVNGLNEALFNRLNSPEYFTIYPPLPQFTFWLSALTSIDSIYGSIIVQRVILLSAEVITVLYLLPKALQYWRKNQYRTLIYALNPMLILEITGNLHHEGLVVFFLLLSWISLRQHKWFSGALAMGGAICSKLLPLLFLPFLWRRLGVKKGLYFYLVTGLFTLIAFAPLYDPTFVHGFRESLSLYFRKFEFNASTFYVIRWIGFQQKGYDIIQSAGPALAKVIFVLIISLAALEKRPRWANLPAMCLAAIMIYLLGTTTVHPWYVTLPILCCIFTNYRFPVVWSILIMGTYINYRLPVYQENLVLVAIEYGIVFIFMVTEWIRNFRGRPSWVLP